ncbi:MAG: glycerol-3-phosphate 1-O-acyltransferase PlsY [Candidatus Nanopelagicales bacterium]
MNEVSLGWALAAVVVGYFVGSINPAAMIAKARGIDLNEGSGNPGATNAARVMGRKTGAIVLVIDLLKGLLPVLLFSMLASPAVGGIAGFAAILGHMTSPFLKGKGGKGVATTLGVLLGAEPLWLIPVLLAFAVVFVIGKRTGIASVAGAVALIVTALVDRDDLEMTIFGVLVGLLVIVRHQRNLRAAWTDWREPVAEAAPPD